MMRYSCACVAALCAMVAPHALATVPGSDPALDELYWSAQEALDGPSAGGAHEVAARKLTQILERDPEYAGAYVELARYLFKSTYEGQGRGPKRAEAQFPKPSLEQATRLLDQALRIEPEFAPPYVLLGYLADSIDREVLGLIALEEAERLGSKSLWIPLNRGRLLISLDEQEAARASYAEALERAGHGSRYHVTALQDLLKITEDVAARDEYHRTLLELRPGSANVRGNYASFLLLNGRNDEAIEHAREAIAMNSYWRARRTLAIALYVKASDLALNQKKPEEAEPFFREAENMDVTANQALFYAVGDENISIAVLGLVDRGADVNSRIGDTSLLLDAFRGSNTAVILGLIERGADVNFRTRGGWTPLTEAMNRGMTDMVELLLDNGADPNVTWPQDERTALDIAIEDGWDDMARLLEQKGARRSVSESASLVAGITRGDTGNMDRAAKYLRLDDPGDMAVLGALQEALVRNPIQVMQVMGEETNLWSRICGRPATSSPSQSVQGRKARVEEIIAASDSPMKVPAQMMRCDYALRNASEEPLDKPRTVPSFSAEERRVELAKAYEAFDRSKGQDSHLSTATGIANNLLRANTRDWDAILLRARTDLAAADYFARVQSNPGSNANRLARIVRLIEAALAENRELGEMLALYAHLLIKEDRQGIARLLLDRADSMGGTNPWLGVYWGELLIAQEDYAAAERRLRTVPRDGGRRLNLEAKLQLATVLQRQGKNDDVHEVYRELIEGHPGDSRPIRGYQDFLLYELADYSAAREMAVKLNDLGELMEDHRVFAQIMLAEATTQLNDEGPTEEVARTFQRAGRQAGSWSEAMFKAVQHPNTQLSIGGMYRAGLDINVMDENGNTLLMYAVGEGDLPVARDLISFGVDVNAANNWGLTALQLAAAGGNERLAQALIGAGAAVDGSQTPDGRSLKELAYSRNMTKLEATLEDVSVGKYPDWQTFLLGVGAAQPVHVERALQLSESGEVRDALLTGLQRWPLTVVRVADANNKLNVACSVPEDRAKSTIVKNALSAVEEARNVQTALAVEPKVDHLTRCMKLLSRELP